jgi:hypothetical protein
MLGIRIALHYGRGTNYNAADAQKEMRCTFENESDDNFDERYVNDMLYENGVERRVLGFSDPFHIANLCVTRASVYAFGDTKKADHTQMHHRQLLQSLHSLHTDNIPFSKAKMDGVMTGCSSTVKFSTKRERVQQWMVNQRNAKKLWRCYASALKLVYFQLLHGHLPLQMYHGAIGRNKLEEK